MEKMSEIRSKPSTKIISGDCLEVLKSLDDNSIDAVITDPPYGLSFMGKKWDYDVPSVEVWRECLRVLKPGGHLLSFAGTRTQHRMAVNIEDAGFEIRDMLAWVYGSGFPKSLNIGKAVDKLQGNEREKYYRDIAYPDSDCWGIPNNKGTYTQQRESQVISTDSIIKEGGKIKTSKGTSEWEGWGTALKPACEPITVARKPLEKGLTVAENCLKWGVGGINIDGCRVGTEEHEVGMAGRKADFWACSDNKKMTVNKIVSGRFPANLIHDGSQEVLDLFPNTKSHGGGKATIQKGHWLKGGYIDYDKLNQYQGDSGSAARFFYCAKASKAERNRGCEGLEEKVTKVTNMYEMERTDGTIRELALKKNNHPTVKPIALMEYLIKLVTREGQTVLDPFAGSGTTGIACKNLNREAILIEREAEYVEIAECRMAM